MRNRDIDAISSEPGVARTASCLGPQCNHGSTIAGTHDLDVAQIALGRIRRR
jgi:hypothetical protein